MGDFLSAIDDHREAILLGELGALLHMFGKCSREFLIANSLEGGANDYHQELKHLPTLAPLLRDPLLRNTFAFTFHCPQETLAGDFTDFITKYKGSKPDCLLVRLFNTCHRMTSADEKGVVRRKQSKDDMWIATPFGHRTHKIGLDRVDAKREEMDRELAHAFESYLSKRIDIKELREWAIRILKPGFSETLGETRQPANDVTLWAQSHGVASLYKPVLATLAMGLDPCLRKNGSLDYNSVAWRLFGIGWNGRSFVERGRRAGDVLKRQEILGEIVTEIQQRIEVSHPIGHRFYADLNGLFFTFPGIEDSAAAELARQLAPELVGIVRERSVNELWPFFTLSKPRRTLTAITKEIEALGRIAAAPRVAPLLSLEQAEQGRQEQLLVGGPSLAQPMDGWEVCPVCQLRGKQRDEETCQICKDRRSNRQRAWHQDRHGRTIWLDEVADTNSRLALVTVRFDLSRWFSGEWLTTLLSQTFDDWLSSDRTQNVVNNQQQRLKLEKITSPVAPTAEVAAAILGAVGTDQVTQDRGFKAPVLSTFFEDVQASQDSSASDYIVPFLKGLRGRINDDPGYRLTPEDLAMAVFTQNASPARLARIWEETEAFLDAWLAGIAAATFATRPQRLGFTTGAVIPRVWAGQTYRIAVPGLTPGPLVVLCLNESRQDFLTVDSLEKFRFEQGDRRLRGVNAVQNALKEGGIESWFDEATGKPLRGPGSPTAVHADRFQTEPYLPFIVLARSPVFCQLLLPANRTAAVLRQLLALTEERFDKVQGKLPLHVGVLVAKRKFPLYALIEAGQQALEDPSFREGMSQLPWWDTTGHADDPFYGHYPTAAPNGGAHRLTDLAPVDHARPFWLTPGYFDFDFLGSTADRHRLTYELAADNRPSRPSIAYGHLRPRPFPLHRLRAVFDIWNLLTARLTMTQLHHLEEAMATKLVEWGEIGNEAGPVFEYFAKALLCRSFGERWTELEPEQRDLLERSARDGLLLETLELFRHVLKEGSSDE
ncbi:MAG: CRISPR-associated protein Csx11 [Chloroflexi bacterium]|nr:CRISPR-associated protein Csx11 [Chloroflexota bacterium]